jgi:hypothetical protein
MLSGGVIGRQQPDSNTSDRMRVCKILSDESKMPRVLGIGMQYPKAQERGNRLSHDEHFSSIIYLRLLTFN